MEAGESFRRGSSVNDDGSPSARQVTKTAAVAAESHDEADHAHEVEYMAELAAAAAQKMMQPDRVLGLLIKRATSACQETWHADLRAVQDRWSVETSHLLEETHQLRDLCERAEARHVAHEQEMFRHAQELTNVRMGPQLGKVELAREADDRLMRIEVNQQELTRRLSAAEVTIVTALDAQQRDLPKTLREQEATGTLARRLAQVEREAGLQAGRMDDAFDSMSIIMDMCERFVTKDEAGKSFGGSMPGDVAAELDARLHSMEKVQRSTSVAADEGTPPPGAVLALQSQLNSLSRQFAAVMDTVLHGENGPAAQSRRMAAIEARVRREQKKLKDDMERLTESTSEHVAKELTRFERASRPVDSTSEEEDGDGGGGSRRRKSKKETGGLPSEESAELQALVAALEAVSAEGQAATAQIAVFDERLRQTQIGMEGMQRVQKGDSSMVRALRLLQKLTSQPDPAAIFAEFDLDGDKQIDRDELRAGFLKLGEKLSEEDIDAIMELADGDGDESIDLNEFEQMGEMTKQAVSSVEMKFADLLQQVEREYARQDQLRGMAEAVKKTIKQALTQQEKRIAETEERRSEIEEQQLQQSLSLIASKVIESEQRINKQVSEMIDTASTRLGSETDALRTRLQHLESAPKDRRLVVPAASLTGSPTSPSSGDGGDGEAGGGGGEAAADDSDEIELDSFISGIGLQ